MHDLVIEQARIVDGTGHPSYLGALAVTAGKISAISADGRRLRGKRMIDAQGLVLAPGFIDPHTHYDGQCLWDPLLTPSSEHGVTTVVMGNCGVGLAPVRPRDRSIVAGDLVNVEAIPEEVLAAGVEFTWETFPEYLEELRRRRFGCHLASLVPLTPLRHFVMGGEAYERAARSDEAEAMASILFRAMEAGAFGFSTSFFPGHLGYQGRPLACRMAGVEELARLGGVLKQLGRGTIEVALASGGPRLMDETDRERLRLLSAASQRPVTWLVVFAKEDDPNFNDTVADYLGPLMGPTVPQITARPVLHQGSLFPPSMFSSFMCFQAALTAAKSELRSLYSDRTFRETFVRELAQRQRVSFWQQTRIVRVGSPRFSLYQGLTVAELAAQWQKEPIDAFFDLALADDLATEFAVTVANFDRVGLAKLLQDDRFVIGLSDGGAHVDFLCDAGYTLTVLGEWVRERQVLSLEKAVHKLTQVPGALYGINDRGTLALGKVADLVLFDPDQVKTSPPEYVYDLPRGGRRLITRASGMHMTFVNGTVVFANGEHSGELPGEVLHGGDVFA